MRAALAKGLRVAIPWLVAAVFAGACVVVVRTVRRQGVTALLQALQRVETVDVAVAGVLAAASYLTLTLYDWLGVRLVVGSRLAYPRVAFTSFAALAVGHTVGFAVLSTATIRYRLYSHFGLRGFDVARVVLCSATTVALGLMSLGGLTALVRPGPVARLSGLPTWAAAALGGLSLLLVAAYVYGAAVSGGGLRVLGRRLPLPGLRVALLQMVVGSTNYVLVAASLHCLLADAIDVSLFTFASYYVVANVLAIVSHVPGGLGILELVVLAAAPGVDTMSALIVFRIVYYLVPFVLGATAYAGFEWRTRAGRRGRAEEPADGPPVAPPPAPR